MSKEKQDAMQIRVLRSTNTRLKVRLAEYIGKTGKPISMVRYMDIISRKVKLNDN